MAKIKVVAFVSWSAKNFDTSVSADFTSTRATWFLDWICPKHCKKMVQKATVF